MTETPPLTRRPDRDPNRSGGWLIYCGDIRVGHIGKQAGVPLSGDQWGWSCGFQPGCDPGELTRGTASDYEDAKTQFEKAWHRLAAKKTEAHFEAWRRSRDFHAWKNRMHNEQMPLPTQRSDGRARCFCGAEITTASLDQHIMKVHRAVG